MTAALTADQARRVRQRAQHLGGGAEAAAGVADVARSCAALQAQAPRQTALGIRARSLGLTEADVTAARLQGRSVVRTWCMRGTLHLVPADDLPWMLQLFGPLYLKRGRRRLAQLGLDDDDCERAVSLIDESLADGGPQTRDELADTLLAAGLEFDPNGQASYHLIRRAALEGVVCQIVREDGGRAYARLDDWLPGGAGPRPDRRTALAALAERYIAAYEPARPDDLYSWSGLYKRDVNAAWESIAEQLTEVEAAGESAWILSDPASVGHAADGPLVRLLPMYDGYLLGHESRELLVPQEHEEQVHPGGGQIRATVAVGGRVAATWRFDRSGQTPSVVVEPFDALPASVERGIEEEVRDIGRFLDLDEIDLTYR